MAGRVRLLSVYVLITTVTGVYAQVPPYSDLPPENPLVWSDAVASKEYGMKAYETLKSLPNSSLRSVKDMSASVQIVIDIYVASTGRVETIAIVSGPNIPGLWEALNKIYKGVMLPPLPPKSPAPIVLRLPIVMQGPEKR